ARVEEDAAGRWTLTVPEPGTVTAADCLHTIDVLTDDAVIQAGVRLNPAAGQMVSALWVKSTGRLVAIVHHLAIDGVSWRILLEDLNLAWAQHRAGQPVTLPQPGTSFQRWATLLNLAWAQHRAGQPVTLPQPGTSFQRWATLLAEHAHDPKVVAQTDTWRQIAATPAALSPASPETDTLNTAGNLAVNLDVETTQMLLGEVPAAFHTGINDILLIAFGLALAEFLGTGA
ncbi:hypothetical protein H7I53_20565, partial [Mycolicibacterium pulveris]|uniref:condensation domain-containing protein n=1 Tax=Mycolicibacterium pulveris TaxID=36813 RepID=UPI0021F3124A